MPEYQQNFLDEKKISTIFLNVTNLSCSCYPLHISVQCLDTAASSIFKEQTLGIVTVA